MDGYGPVSIPRRSTTSWIPVRAIRACSSAVSRPAWTQTNLTATWLRIHDSESLEERARVSSPPRHSPGVNETYSI